MPGRDQILVNGEIYHVYNRGITHQDTFIDPGDYYRALDTLVYYRPEKFSLRYSHYIRLTESTKQELSFQAQQNSVHLVDLVAYCFMPNHFHLLIQQRTEERISNFLSRFTNSYTRYFNTKRSRIGPLFQGRFKAVRIEGEEQLIHVSRYIHLNPYSAGMVNSASALSGYTYSSYPEYLGLSPYPVCQKVAVLSIVPRDVYSRFVVGHADYQRELQLIKHLLLE